MCLDIDVRYHPNYGKKGSAFIAQQPILVYKRLNCADKTGGKAPYQGTRWDFGVEQRVPRFGYWGQNRREIDVGLHAFFTKDANRCYGDVFPAVIPAGARFFLGTNGEVVSTALTVYRTQKEMLAAFGAKAVGPAIKRHTLTKRAR
ncbi:predicted ORF [Xanthomonas phage XacN1]|nr:predicted ORF [Xanthomonas phage XacN1]BBA65680.1 predicted ORF [Xanthomonas phage XacN1]